MCKASVLRQILFIYPIFMYFDRIEEQFKYNFMVEKFWLQHELKE